VRLVTTGVGEDRGGVHGAAKALRELWVTNRAELRRRARLVERLRAAGVARRAAANRVIGAQFAEVITRADLPQVSVVRQVVVVKQVGQARGERVAAHVAKVAGEAVVAQRRVVKPARAKYAIRPIGTLVLASVGSHDPHASER